MFSCHCDFFLCINEGQTHFEIDKTVIVRGLKLYILCDELSSCFDFYLGSNSRECRVVRL